MRQEGSGLIHIATYVEPWRSAAFAGATLSLELMAACNVWRAAQGRTRRRRAVARGLCLALLEVLVVLSLSTAVVAERFGTHRVTVESGAIPWQTVAMRLNDGGYCIGKFAVSGGSFTVDNDSLWIPWLPLPRNREVGIVLDIVRCGS
jgi:hypothetical protein